ncbi:MAG: GIY-YIG nuclease family protein [Patescibacteria group bacterium]
MLKSLVAQKFYTGKTNNIGRRLAEHNSGKSRYTKRHKPWELVYSENFPSEKEAAQREKYLKSAAGRKWLKNVYLKS